MEKFNVLGTGITYYRKNDQDYISLTDMLKAKDDDFCNSSALGSARVIARSDSDEAILKRIASPLRGSQ